MRSFLTELRRRNVFRAGALYVAGVWALAQGIAQLGPAFGLPDWGTRWFVIAGCIGFPFWVAFAWFYEFTPKGLKRESEIEPAESITRHTARKLDFAIIVVLAVAVVLLLTDRFVPRGNAVSEEFEKSIAVLPFESLSDDKANAYFAEGIQDEILTRLAHIGALRVVSRTSTEQYASKPGNLSEIARQLGVANIVEGSVQKAGDVVRINVQLIRAATDAHLWAELYDRKLDNLFSVQSEVANAIAAQLQAQLTHEEKKDLATPPTTNVKAHDAWLRAVVFFNRAGEDPNGVELAITQLKLATDADPNFVAAWALLSRSHGSQYFQQFDHSPERAAAAKAALDRAAVLEPNHIDTQVAVGYYQYWVQRDFAAALTTFAAIEVRQPNNLDAIQAQAYIARRQGRVDDAVRGIDRAVELNPRDSLLLTEAAWTHGQKRDFEGMMRIVDQALNIKPDDANLIATKALALISLGRVDESGALLRDIPLDGDSPQAVFTVAMQAYMTRDFAGASAQLRPMLDRLEASRDASKQLATLGQYAAIVGDLELRAGQTEPGKQTLRLAIAQLERVRREEPGNFLALMRLAQAQSVAGDREASMATIGQAIAAAPSATDALYGPLLEEWRARIEVRFGEINGPITDLARLLKEDYAAPVTPANLRLDVDWDPLRSDPRFQALLGKD